MKRIYKTNKGYLLSEVLISMFLLIMTAATTVGLVIYAYGAINFNKHALVAGMLVKECSESVIGLRDTNFLRFGYDKAACWKVNDITCPSPTGKELNVGFYNLDVPLTGESVFTEIPSVLNLSDGISPSDAPYRLKYYDTDPLLDSDGDGDSVNDQDAFTTGAGIANSLYFRMLEVTSSGPDSLTAVCSVAWMEGNDPKQIGIPVMITYYE